MQRAGQLSVVMGKESSRPGCQWSVANGHKTVLDQSRLLSKQAGGICRRGVECTGEASSRPGCQWHHCGGHQLQPRPTTALVPKPKKIA